MNKVIIVIPAYNEAKVIASVVSNVLKHGFANIVVIDDGSSDSTGAKAQQAGALVITHRLNRGKGAATKTGIEAARLMQADIIVTMDGDGQHAASDIKNLIEPILRERCHVVLGSRLCRQTSMPKHKIIQNTLANAMTWVIHRQWVTDSQSGFRAYSREAASLINTRADFYDYDSEVIREIRTHKISFLDVPITARYTSYSQSKPQKQSLANGIKTACRMIWHLIS